MKKLLVVMSLVIPVVTLGQAHEKKEPWNPKKWEPLAKAISVQLENKEFQQQAGQFVENFFRTLSLDELQKQQMKAILFHTRNLLNGSIKYVQFPAYKKVQEHIKRSSQESRDYDPLEEFQIKKHALEEKTEDRISQLFKQNLQVVKLLNQKEKAIADLVTEREKTYNLKQLTQMYRDILHQLDQQPIQEIYYFMRDASDVVMFLIDDYPLPMLTFFLFLIEQALNAFKDVDYKPGFDLEGQDFTSLVNVIKQHLLSPELKAELDKVVELLGENLAKISPQIKQQAINFAQILQKIFIKDVNVQKLDVETTKKLHSKANELAEEIKKMTPGKDPREIDIEKKYEEKINQILQKESPKIFEQIQQLERELETGLKKIGNEEQKIYQKEMAKLRKENQEYGSIEDQLRSQREVLTKSAQQLIAFTEKLGFIKYHLFYYTVLKDKPEYSSDVPFWLNLYANLVDALLKGLKSSKK